MRYKLLALFAVGALLMASNSSNAQELGIRGGEAMARSSIAIDFVKNTSESTRIHANVGFGNGVGIDVLWGFIKPLGGESLNWYAGLGAATFLGDPFELGVTAEIGLEYRFAGVPLAIGADYRPTFRIIENTDFLSGFGLNIRYVFGKK